MRVLVTGGAGFIGSHLVDALVHEGHVVRILDSLEQPTHPGGRVPEYMHPAAELLVGDVTMPDALLASLREVEVVFHLAATGGFTDRITDYVRINSLGTAGLLQCIRDHQLPVKKLIVASSVAVYGEGKYLSSDGVIFSPASRTGSQLGQGIWHLNDSKGAVAQPLLTDESSPVNPLSYYGISKLDEEMLVLQYGRQYGMATTALRFFLTYGPRQSVTNPYTGVCSIFSTQIANNKAPVVFEDGLQTRDFVHVSDVVQACMLAMRQEGANGRALNVGTGKAVTIAEVANALCRLLGGQVEPVISGNYRIGDVRHIVADISAISALGYKPSMNLQDGLKTYTDWLQLQPNVKDYFAAAYAQLQNSGVIRTSR